MVFIIELDFCCVYVITNGPDIMAHHPNNADRFVCLPAVDIH